VHKSFSGQRSIPPGGYWARIVSCDLLAIIRPNIGSRSSWNVGRGDGCGRGPIFSLEIDSPVPKRQSYSVFAHIVL